VPTTQISVCILAGHGLAALDACLASLQTQLAPPPFELLVGGTPTPDVIEMVHARFPTAQVCDTAGRLPGAARNPLIERATGRLLLFLDDDVTAPPDLLGQLVATAAQHPEASVFGGPNETPPRSSRFQVVQGAVLSSLMGAGPVSRRYGARHPGPADERWFTLCNLAVRRDVMLPFVTHLVCAEENALLAGLRRRGERMHYEPELRVFHARRPRIRSFAAQMRKYGRGRGELLRRDPRTLRAAYLAPVALLIYVLVAAATIVLRGPTLLALVPAILYGVLILATALRVAWTLRRLTAAPLAAALIAIVHGCYGAGMLRGVCFPGRARPEAAVRWTAPEGHARNPTEQRGDGEPAAARRSIGQEPA
jgi:succinoglycan biosynthesis protein ExoA